MSSASSGPERGSAKTPKTAQPSTQSNRKKSGQRCSRAKFLAIKKDGLMSVSRLPALRVRLRTGQFQEQLFQRTAHRIHAHHVPSLGPDAFDDLALAGLRS